MTYLAPHQGSRWALALLFVASSVFRMGAVDVVLLQDSVAETNALTFTTADASFGTIVNGRTHQQLPLTTFNGYQYTTYYDANRNVCLGRRPLPAGPWEIIRFTDHTLMGSDTHDTTVVGICEGDGTIHLAFDHHVSDLHYRVSAHGVASNPESVVWEASLFGPITKFLGSVGPITKVTYPRFVSAPNGNLMFYYRFVTSANGDGMIQEYNATTHDWTPGLGRFIARDIGTYTEGGESSHFRCPYLNSISYAGNRLQVSWIWRDKFTSTSKTNNHDICYAYSNDDGRTWMNSGGTNIGVTGSSYITLDSPGLVVAPVNRNSGLDNQNTHYAFPDGSLHIVLGHYLSGTTTKRYHHYWRNAAGVWNSAELTFSGGRPKLVGDSDGHLFLAYTSGDTLRIAKGVPNAGMTAWTWSLVFTQSNPTDGGEAAVDLTRWEKERVLSVYGQEEPSIDGDPSPLHVLDYQVSTKATLPRPAHQATGVVTNTNVQWTAGLNALSHQVYWGTNLAAVTSATTNSSEYKGRQAGTVYQPSPLEEALTYYWRIDEVQTGSVVIPGLVWQFTTLAPQPPAISPIVNQVVLQDTSTPAIPFTVTDDVTPATDLVVTGDSSYTLLVPNPNIVFGGSGSNRTVTVTPAATQTGTTLITVTVNDGALTNSTTFLLTVNPLVIPQDEDLGTWDVSTTWDPDGVTMAGFNYSTDRRLRTPATSATFAGDSLTVLPNGPGFTSQLQLRNTGMEVVTAPNLILAGGQVFAGTGNNVTNTLDGNIHVTADSSLRGYWNATGPRNLRLLSLISGAGVLTSHASSADSTHRLLIDNSANTFAGSWVSERGTIQFANAGAVGKADIVVQADGKLAIQGDWNQAINEVTLTVADSANALVDLSSNHWTVAGLMLGGSSVVDGTYTATQLDAMSATVFSGTGSLTVGVPIVESPILTAVQSGNDLVFSWMGEGFKMQVQTNDLMGLWLDYPGGTNSPLPVPIDVENGSVFFRLIQGP